MVDRSENKKWLQQARKSWLVLAQGGLWIGAMVGGFLLPPPIGVLGGDEKIWLRFGQFVIAMVLGLVFFVARRWKLRRHALRWWGGAVVFLAIGVAAFFRYQQLTLAWTSRYLGQRMVVGSVYTPQGLSYTKKNPGISGDDLIFDFAGVTEDIWTRESIDRRRLLLAATYVSCLPLFTLCLISVVQASQCGDKPTKKKSRSLRLDIRLL